MEMEGSGELADYAYPIGFVLLPDFPMIAFAAALEPLRTANRLSKKKLYDWILISTDGDSVRASNGIEIATACSIDTMPALPMVLVVGGTGIEHYHSPRVSAWLRRLARTNTRLGAISGAPYVFARAGLLHERRCTLHWEQIEHFAEAFPSCIVTQDIFVADGRLLTCSGGMAPLDMMLWVIAEQQGAELARAVSDTSIHPKIRERTEKQRMEIEARLGITNRHIVAVVDQMERNIEQPLGLGALSRVVGLSPRHLGRLFQEHLGEGPHQYYLRLRLERARVLLSQSDQSILDIGLACGFSSASHFSQSFARHFGLAPGAARRRERIVVFSPAARSDRESAASSRP
jgi:transcriptional regulator GlxA family with amidase domain